jgi:hypothetical protein
MILKEKSMQIKYLSRQALCAYIDETAGSSKIVNNREGEGAVNHV